MTPNHARWFVRHDATIAGALVIAAYTVAAWNLAALSWDGSWYFFRSLQDQTPFTPHLRFGTYPILWLLVALSKVVHDPRALGVCYGLLLSLIPVGSLLLSWHFLRRAPRAALRIWPAMGILLAALPGQLCLMSEATLVAQLLWPILAIIASGPPGVGGGIWLAALSVAAAFLHPTSILIFGLAAVLFGWQGWAFVRTRKPCFAWAMIFATMASAKLLATLSFATDYERSQFSINEVRNQLADSILGYPMLLLGLTYLLGFILLASAADSVRAPRLFANKKVLCGWIPAAMLIAGLYWANHPAHWQGLLDYRRFVLPAMLPLVAMSLWHFRVITAAPAPIAPPLPPVTLSWVAAVFAGVLIVQAVAWGTLLDRFSASIFQHAPETHFVAGGDLPFIRNTPLKHWTASPLSILLQGRQPAVIFVKRREDIHTADVQVNQWEQIPLVDGWFTLSPLQAADPAKR